MSKKDQGFLIKNFGDKGWGLFNLTSMATIMPQSKSANSAQTVKTEKREDNAFTNLLAKAADDSTIKEKPVIEKPVEKKADATASNTEKKEEVKEIAPSSQSEIKNGVPSSQSEIKNGIIVAPVVIKMSQRLMLRNPKMQRE
jgi:DNA-directed RNA polymerase delta subunit